MLSSQMKRKSTDLAAMAQNGATETIRNITLPGYDSNWNPLADL